MMEVESDLNIQRQSSYKPTRAKKFKQALFQKLKKTKNTKIVGNVAPKHKYFTLHQCYLSPEKVNSQPIKCSSFRMCLLNWIAVHFGDIRAENLFRSYSELCAEKYRQYKNFPLSIHPFSKLRIWFEECVMVSLIASYVALACHFTEKNLNQGNHYVFLYVVLYDYIYVFNILINFLTGYVEGNTLQYVVLDLRKIVCKYVRTWFIVDLASSLSLVPGLFHIEDVYLYLILISIKLLRIPTLLGYLNNVLIVLRVGIFGKTMIEISVMILSYLTWNMYFQFAIEYMKMGSFSPNNPDNCSWISVANIWNESTSLRFMYTFDRAVGMLRKNSNINMVKQKGCIENFLIVAWIIAKLLVYHCALKYIVSLFGKESAKAKYFIMTKQVETLMNQRRFPPRIKEKILKFYAIRFQSHYFEETRMLNCVTGQLREDIIMHTGRQLVRELEFLKQLPRSLLLQIGLKLKIVIFIAGDIIFKINTVGDCLYFIDKGSVAIYSESGNEICHLEDGDYFGEIALVMKHCMRTASAVAVTNCELFRLDKDDFNNSIACYPTVYENIKKVAINRYEKTCVLDEHHKAELKMAQDHAAKVFTDEPSVSTEDEM